MSNEEIIITEGLYCQKDNKKSFKVKIYRLKDTKELCILVPNWVSEEPKDWLLIKEDEVRKIPQKLF